MELQGVAWGKQMSDREAMALSPLHWAYVGDAVFELVARCAHLRPGVPLHEVHRRVVAQVSAVGQEALWQRIAGLLTDEEAEVARRGRNAKSSLPHRSDPAAYRRSTALEALVGYLYLTGRYDRILQLLASMGSETP